MGGTQYVCPATTKRDTMLQAETQDIEPDNVVFEDFSPSSAVGEVLRTLYSNPEKYKDGSSKFGINVSDLCEDAGVSNSTAWRTLDTWWEKLEATREGDSLVLRPKPEEPEEVEPEEADTEAEETEVSAEAVVPGEAVTRVIDRYKAIREEADRETGGREPEGTADRMLYRHNRMRRSMADMIVEDLEILLHDFAEELPEDEEDLEALLGNIPVEHEV